MADIFDFYVYDDRSIRFAIAEPIMLEDKDVTQFRFRIPKVLNNIDMTDWEWWFIFVNAKKVKYTTQLTLTDDEDDPDNFSVATYTVGYGFSGYVGQVSFSIEALNVSGEDIVNEWHTRTYNTHVIDTLQGTRAVIPEPEADAGTGLTAEEKSLILELFSKAAYAENDASTAYDRLEALWTVITRLVSLNLTHVTSSNQSASVENGSRYVTNLTADTNYSINEVTVTMGGVDITSTAYSSGTITIPSVTGNIVITATAVLAAQSITATYTQSGTVYDTDSLDSLKADLVVTANYSGGTSETVPASDYTLSGTLTAGTTSTITVNYAGLTDTFSVVVSLSATSFLTPATSWNTGSALTVTSSSADGFSGTVTAKGWSAWRFGGSSSNPLFVPTSDVDGKTIHISFDCEITGYSSGEGIVMGFASWTATNPTAGSSRSKSYDALKETTSGHYEATVTVAESGIDIASNRYLGLYVYCNMDASATVSITNIVGEYY